MADPSLGGSIHVDREHEAKDYVDEAIKFPAIIVLGVHQSPGEKDPHLGVWC